MDLQLKFLYKIILVRNKKVLVWRSKSNPNCFKVKFDTRPGEKMTYVVLHPSDISKSFCRALWDWELYPKRILYI